MNGKQETPQLNAHNKQEFPPMHTAEHLLNALMVKLFGCERSRNAHIERRKSKVSYTLPSCPDAEQVEHIVNEMNRLIQTDMPVTYEYVPADRLPPGVDASRLPAAAGEVIRLVRIGDYDLCPCIGRHVGHTREIGRFVLLGTNWDEDSHNFRIRFKLAAG